MWWELSLPHIPEEETEAQKGKVAAPKSSLVSGRTGINT